VTEPAFDPVERLNSVMVEATSSEIQTLLPPGRRVIPSESVPMPGALIPPVTLPEVIRPFVGLIEMLSCQIDLAPLSPTA
jgi:hypothetical protein